MTIHDLRMLVFKSILLNFMTPEDCVTRKPFYVIGKGLTPGGLNGATLIPNKQGWF